MILLKLDRKHALPLYMQIVKQVEQMMEEETLVPGTKLPSSRTLAYQLGVNRSTVTNAYQELWALGYIESRPGSYSRIRKRHRMATPANKSKKGMIEWENVVSPASHNLYEIFQDFSPEYKDESTSKIINLSRLDMDDRIFPTDDFRRCMHQALMNNGARILGYGEHMGYGPLRETIAHRLQTHGISVTAEEILITNGSQNGIELVFKLLTVPGGEMAIESPTYANVLPLLKFYQTKIVEIPMTETGLDLDCLKNVLTKRQPAFLYTIPNFHNPTGVTTTQAHREALLSICEQYQMPIVEDGFEEEMKYFGKVPLPIKSIDKNQIVIYLGTFSKVLFPGIRVGWIAAEKECIQRLLALKRFGDLSSNSVIQATLYEFCRRGYYDLHIRRMHRIFRKRMHTALKAMKEHLPADKVRWQEPSGGYLIWIHLPNLDPEKSHLEEIFHQHGVLVSWGKKYFPHYQPQPYFRISISMLDEDEIEEGIKRLGDVICRIYNI